MNGSPARTLTTAPASVHHAMLALGVSLTLIVIATVTWPYGTVDGPRVPVMISMPATIISVCDIITAALLFIQFRQQRTTGVLILGAAYAFTALMAIAWLLTFPVLLGLGLGSGTEITAWIWVYWHSVYPIAVLTFAISKDRLAPAALHRHGPLVAVGATIALMALLLMIAIGGEGVLPLLVAADHTFTVFTMHRLYPALIAINFVAFGVLLLAMRRQPTVVTLWLCVSMLAFCLDLLTSWNVDGRFDVGWYVARLDSLVASLLLAIVFIVENAHLLRDWALLSQRLMHLNKDLEAARIEREVALAAKMRFVAAAGHDLRQPFQALRLFHAMLAGSDDPVHRQRALDGLRHALGAAENVIDEITDMARIEGGNVEVKLQPVEVTTLLGEVVATFAPVAGDKGLCLRLRGSPAVINADPTLLRRVVSNLVSNAIRYTERGGVLVALRRRTDALRIEVWDTGIGIADDARQRIFDEFYQLETGGAPGVGLGLGLAIVKRLCGLLSYDVSVSSRPGRGSVFSIRIPLPAPSP